MILLELLYHMLKECHTLRGRKLTHLTSNDGHTLFALAGTITGGFPLLADHAQWLEFAEKVCAVLYMVVSVLEQSHWPLSNPTSISIASLVESLMHKMVHVLTFVPSL